MDKDHILEENLGVDSLDMPLERFSGFLSERTLGPLRRAGIVTLRDLVKEDSNDLLHIKGFGKKCYDELISFIEKAPDILERMEAGELVWGVDRPECLKLHEWMNEDLKPNYVETLTKLYGLIDGESHTLDEVGGYYNVSRERIRQMKERALEKMRQALLSGRIESRLTEEFDKLAKKHVKVDSINSLSEVYNNGAVAKMLVDATKKNAIFSHNYLRSKWLVDNKDEMDTMMRTAKDWLDSQPGFVWLEELSKQSGVPKYLLEDMANAKIEGGQIALVNGYRKDGINRAASILAVLKSAVRPMSLEEIAKKTNAPIASLRARIYEIPGVVNVGRSMFALEEYGYTNKDAKELAVEFLKESQEPRHINDIIKHVLYYRLVDEDSVKAAIYVNDDVFTRFSNGYVALAEWGYESDTAKRVKYEVLTREAILGVMQDCPDTALTIREIGERIEQKYGDRASNVDITIRTEVGKMTEEGLLERLGAEGAKTYYYKLGQTK